MMNVKPLEEVLTYENKWVLQRFKAACHWFKGTDEEAALIFEDLKKYLWLYAKIEALRLQNPEKDYADISIAYNMEIIDEMWHAFVLYTQFYIEFCEKYFGAYLHHPVPCKKYLANIDSMGYGKANEIFVSEMVECVYEELGEEVAVRWFDEYEKFNSPDGASEHHATV